MNSSSSCANSRCPPAHPHTNTHASAGNMETASFLLESRPLVDRGELWHEGPNKVRTCVSKCISCACVDTNGEGVCHHGKKEAEGRHVSNGCQNGISCSKQKMCEACLGVRMSKDSCEEQKTMKSRNSSTEAKQPPCYEDVFEELQPQQESICSCQLHKWRPIRVRKGRRVDKPTLTHDRCEGDF